MEYKEIIRNNCENVASVNWWPQFAYHYTDVKNAVSILTTGLLYSRADAESLKIMQNDNASRRVIDMTNSHVVSKARFYFRPLTPTQYYNEGFKHPLLRYNWDDNTNAPLPIFFLFDLEKLLSMEGAEFSETSQAGHGSPCLAGVDNFSKLDFEKIYDNKICTIKENKQYRHAEILYPVALPIDSCIKYICCRNDVERITLLNMLKYKNFDIYSKYYEIIKVHNSNLFLNNGLYVKNCAYGTNSIDISFRCSSAYISYVCNAMRHHRLKELSPINMKVFLVWFNALGPITQQQVYFKIKAIYPQDITIKNLSDVPEADMIRIVVYFEDKPMCLYEQPLHEASVPF